MVETVSLPGFPQNYVVEIVLSDQLCIQCKSFYLFDFEEDRHNKT